MVTVVCAIEQQLETAQADVRRAHADVAHANKVSIGMLISQ